MCQRLIKRRERKDVNKKMKKETELDREETDRETYNSGKMYIGQIRQGSTKTY